MFSNCIDRVGHQKTKQKKQKTKQKNKKQNKKEINKKEILNSPPAKFIIPVYKIIRYIYMPHLHHVDSMTCK